MRGGYRKKNVEAANKHLHDNMSALDISGTIILQFSTTANGDTRFVVNYQIVIGI